MDEWMNMDKAGFVFYVDKTYFRAYQLRLATQKCHKEYVSTPHLKSAIITSLPQTSRMCYNINNPMQVILEQINMPGDLERDSYWRLEWIELNLSWMCSLIQF